MAADKAPSKEGERNTSGEAGKKKREQRQRANALFAQALELPPAEGSAFLDRSCGDDYQLRRKVERLLAADREAGDFLEPPKTDVLPLSTVDPPDADRIGAYRILHRLGRGGMATVYLAERDGDQQKAAIKLLSSGTASGELRARFRRERRFLARLEHPNVARLYGGGTTADGRPYLAMEYVEGLPVDEYCDRHQLTVKERIDLFRKICTAVEFAHQNLLVHRDLKPDNVLINAEGEPKLLDFGIAKLLDHDLSDEPRLTQTGYGPMTPSYASPEQVRAEAVSTASDVYSLGVMLYELLTGRSPYRVQRSTPHKIAWAVCEQEPEPMSATVGRADITETASQYEDPRSNRELVARARRVSPDELRRRLRGDLDHIVACALRKEPPQRYASVGRLSEDLERHLLSLPILARRGSFNYRFGKFVRRHRAPLAALAAVAVLVLGFVTALAFQARELTRERDSAERALAFLVDILKAPEPGRARGETITARQILDRGAERIQRETEGQPEVRATMMDAVGQVYLDLGLLERAEPLLQGALVLRLQHLRKDHPAVADSLQHLALLKHEMGDYRAAESLFQQALELRRETLGNDHLKVAESLDGLSTTLRWSGQLDGAEPVHREALEIRRRRLGERHALVAKSLDSLASLSLRLGDYPRAAELYSEAEEIQRQSLGQDHPDRAMTLKNLALTLSYLGDLERSEVLTREAVAVLRKTLGDEHPWFLQGLLNLGAIISYRGDHQEAEVVALEAFELQHRHLSPQHPDLTLGLNRLGKVRRNLGKLDQAEGHFLEALEVAQASLGKEHPRTGHILSGLASVMLRRGDLEAAERLFEESLATLADALHDRHLDLSIPMVGLGQVALANGDPAAAEPHLRRALELLRAALPRDHWRIAVVESELGACLALAGHRRPAEALLEASTANLSARFGADDTRAERARHRLEELRAE